MSDYKIPGMESYFGDKFKSKKSSEQPYSPYDENSKLFEDLAQRNYSPVSVVRLDLTSAGSTFVNIPGYHFVILGDDNSANKAVNTNILVNVWINKRANSGENPFPAKNARGFSGPFAYLYLEWAAQSGAYADLIIYKSCERPWIDGETCT